MLNAITSFISFSVVLWGLSSVLSFAVWGHRLSIPGYLFFAATLYGVLGLWLVGLIGKNSQALLTNNSSVMRIFERVYYVFGSLVSKLPFIKGRPLKKHIWIVYFLGLCPILW